VAIAAVNAFEARRLWASPTLLGGHDIRADELSARACALAGKRPPRFKVSARATATAAYWAEWCFAVMGQRAPMPSLPALLLCEAWATGQGEAHRLGMRPRPLDETLRDSIAWYQRIGYLRD